MENFKFILFSVIVLAIIALVGYWAFVTLEPGNIYMEKQKQQELEQKNQELEKEIKTLNDQIQALKDAQAPAPSPVVTEPVKTTTPTSTTTLKYQSLINDLQKLINSKVFMKEKSQGSRVGTIQTFLNIYNKTSKKVDNDYGPGLKTDVMNFQKAQGLLADGEAGPSTFQKMIDWLKKQ